MKNLSNKILGCDKCGKQWIEKKKVKEFIEDEFEILEELLSVETAMKIEKEFIKLAGKKFK